MSVLRTCVLIGSFFLVYYFETEGFVLQFNSYCTFDTIEDMQYQLMFAFNKQTLLQYNPTLGKFIPFVYYGYNTTVILNNNTALLEDIKQRVNTTCRRTMREYQEKIVKRRAQPSVAVNTVVPQTTTFTTALLCRVDGFYPPEVSLSWQKNGEMINQSVYIKPIMPNGDWTYQISATVEFTPSRGDCYTCLVNHVSLAAPIAIQWKAGISNYKAYYSIAATVVFIVGLLFLFLGIIFWKSSFSGFMYIPIYGNTDE
ncbi:HLA class II histocompatibility antigen, DO beta chain-like [Protopterus annectens]|uniref:HLA class II histocompatibility antigen, DO beta chain-like n=1 Tax=Protopterus annectens TaxID=7888 RepID=UPI001CFA3813|nr:HLA class II histocompatibility antigen, DO beta chain-like [Protopterus annectens]